MKPSSPEHYLNNLLTLDELCDLLKVSKSTVYSWVSDGLIPVVKVGRLVRFNSNSIKNWLEKRERAGRLTREIYIEP